MIAQKRLTKKGSKKFKSTLEDFGENDWKEVVLDWGDFDAEEIEGSKMDEMKKFENTLELAKYLYEILGDEEIEGDRWNFLSIVFYKQLLKKDGKVGRLDRLLIDPEKYSYPFAHLLKAPYDLYRFYAEKPELIKFLLLHEVNVGETAFCEIVRNQEIMKNEKFIEVCKKIFYDGAERKLKRGTAGNIVRLIAVFRQYERTYDMYGMPSEMILSKLISPLKEFDRFKSGVLRKSF